MFVLKKDYRPYAVKKAYLKFQKFYTSHFIKPRLEFLGAGFTFMRPWHLELFGEPIKIGDFATVIATSDRKIRLAVWPKQKESGYINIGRFCIICPGVRISSACGIDIGDNCMLASNVYITDCDWHGLYDRTSFGKAISVRFEENVWIGDSAIICKGVTIGQNSIVGAGTVVVDSVPPNTVVAGNPAKIVKVLDPKKILVTRKKYFSNPTKLVEDFKKWELESLAGNTIWGWLRYVFFPHK